MGRMAGGGGEYRMSRMPTLRQIRNECRWIFVYLPSGHPREMTLTLQTFRSSEILTVDTALGRKLTRGQ